MHLDSTAESSAPATVAAAGSLQQAEKRSGRQTLSPLPEGASSDAPPRPVPGGSKVGVTGVAARSRPSVIERES